MKKGSKGAAVTKAQQLLDLLGYPPGPIDGEFGPKTVKAVKAFQKDYGIKVDGIVGPLTWAMLGS